MDQSSGHGHMREGALNVNTMSARVCAKQPRLTNTSMHDVGTYKQILAVCDVLSKVFLDKNECPFYMNPED